MIAYTAMEASLFAILAAALSAVDGAPALELDDPRLADPPEEEDEGEVENRFRATLMPGAIAPSDQQIANPPPYQLVTTFRIGLHGVGSKDTTRRALVRAMASACAAAVDADWTLNGVASFAQAAGLDTDTAKESGFAPENLLDIEIEVEWDAPTRVG